MKKSLWIIVCTTLLSVSSYAQDVITFRNGNEIKAKVLEIKTEEIVYKNEANPEGPTYYVKKAEVFMIKYANGSKEVFETPPTIVQKPIDNYSEDRKGLRRMDRRERTIPENVERFNSVFLDHGGNGMYISVNYERLFKIKDENEKIRHLVSTKLGYTPFVTLNVINATASYNIGDGRNFLEVGGGAGYYFQITTSWGGNNPYAFFTPIFGFRRIAPSGFLFRAYFSTYCLQTINNNYNYRTYTYNYTYNYTYYPFMGVSLGFSF